MCGEDICRCFRVSGNVLSISKLSALTQIFKTKHPTTAWSRLIRCSNKVRNHLKYGQAHWNSRLWYRSWHQSCRRLPFNQQRWSRDDKLTSSIWLNIRYDLQIPWRIDTKSLFIRISGCRFGGNPSPKRRKGISRTSVLRWLSKSSFKQSWRRHHERRKVLPHWPSNPIASAGVWRLLLSQAIYSPVSSTAESRSKITLSSHHSIAATRNQKEGMGESLLPCAHGLRYWSKHFPPFFRHLQWVNQGSFLKALIKTAANDL